MDKLQKLAYRLLMQGYTVTLHSDCIYVSVLQYNSYHVTLNMIVRRYKNDKNVNVMIIDNNLLEIKLT